MREHPVTSHVVVPVLMAATLYLLQVGDVVSKQQAWYALAVLIFIWLALGLFVGWPAILRYFMAATNRTEIEEARSLKQQFRRAKNRGVEGVWVAGVGPLALGHDATTDKFGRVVLPNPGDAVELGRIAPLSDYSSTKTLKEVIEDNTKRLIERGARVKWSRRFPEFTMLMVNPTSHLGWIHVQLLVPNMLPEHQPVFRAWPVRDPGGVAALRKVFDQLWDDAEDISEDFLLDTNP